MLKLKVLGYLVCVLRFGGGGWWGFFVWFGFFVVKV